MVHGIYLEEREKKANEAPKKTRPNVEPLSFSLLGSEHQCLPQQGCSQKEVKGRKRENVVPFFCMTQVLSSSPWLPYNTEQDYTREEEGEGEATKKRKGEEG